MSLTHHEVLVAAAHLHTRMKQGTRNRVPRALLDSRLGLRHSHPMHCVVTAGPTYEELDAVRRLTNFSTGRLGSELVNYLASKGHQVTLLIGSMATYRGERHADRVETFTTTTSLAEKLMELRHQRVDALFHAAAVSDFTFGKVWSKAPDGTLEEVTAGKLSTRDGTLLAELAPTPKIIGSLREWFPKGKIAGWKYEVDGDRNRVIELARRQILQCQTDACVANGPGYGEGFGVVTRNAFSHLADARALYPELEELVRR